MILNFDPHQVAPTLLAFLKRLVLQHRLLPLMPSATYFLSTATKSRQKMPLSNAEGLGTAQSAFVIARQETACKVGCKMDVGCETALRAVRDGFV